MLICGNCGTEDFYFAEKKGNFCAWCGQKIKPAPDQTLKFGKYKGRRISSMKSEREIQYLDWVLANITRIDKKLKTAIEYQINIYGL